MRLLITLCLAMVWLVAPAFAGPDRGPTFNSRDEILNFVWKYREKPVARHVPAAMRAASRIGAFRDPESAGVFVGFMAGALAANPQQADAMIAKTLPLPDEDQWFLVRAIAYSGLRNWKGLLQAHAHRMPARRVMIDTLLAGKLPTLGQFVIKEDPTWYENAWDTVRVDKHFRAAPPAPVVLEPSPDLIDTFWGYYFATGSYTPVAQVIALLQWSKERDSAERLTIGSMAKYTLTLNASRDRDILRLLKWAATQPQPHPKRVLPALKDAIQAAETSETTRVRKEALAALDELKRKGPYSRRHVAWWGQVGEGALALGCLGAAVAGQIQFGLPCVLGGALTSAGLRWWATKDY